MSYDIELKNKVTGETATMRHPQYVRGGNVPARLNPITGRLEQAEQAEALSLIHILLKLSPVSRL